VCGGDVVQHGLFIAKPKVGSVLGVPGEHPVFGRFVLGSAGRVEGSPAPRRCTWSGSMSLVRRPGSLWPRPGVHVRQLGVLRVPALSDLERLQARVHPAAALFEKPVEQYDRRHLLFEHLRRSRAQAELGPLSVMDQARNEVCRNGADRLPG